MTPLTSPAAHPGALALRNSLIAPVNEQPQVVGGATESPGPQPLSALKIALGERCNRQALADKLQGIIKDLPQQLARDQPLAKARASMDAALASHLRRTLMYVCEDSSHVPLQPLPANRLISLEAYLLGCGLPVPKTLSALAELKNTSVLKAQVHPLGNLSGGLGWPVPMPKQDQSSINSLMHSNTSGLPGLPLADSAKGALGYLMSGSSVTEGDLKTPVIAMEKLLGSSKAQALGQAFQSRLGGVPHEGGRNDYVMTAIHLGLDPQSLAAPVANSVAGFNVASAKHWGQSASMVVEALGKYLVDEGRASAQTAYLAAYLSLARTAPEFLVKDIPASVTYGSVLWAQLAMAVGKIEAQTPGRTLAMGYAEILLTAEKLDTDAVVSQQIDQQALWDWGFANGHLNLAQETPSAADRERVRSAFNSQLSALKTTSTLLQTPIPFRKAEALAQLKEAFPELDTALFEVRNIQKANLKPGRPGLYPGMRSMLDIVSEGGKLGAEDHWISNDKRIPINTFCSLYQAGKLNVATSFNTAYVAAINAHEKGQQAMVRHLISTLPLEDRENLEFGTLEFFHTNEYKIAGDFFTPPALHVRGHQLEVKTTRKNGQVDLYRIDTRRGAIEKINFRKRWRTEPYTVDKMQTREANILSKTVVVKPDEYDHARWFLAKPEGAGQPDSFNSQRSHAIADVFVKSLDLNNVDLLNEARGVTSFDQDRARNEAIGEFFLNLIPLRSAIVNFQGGNIGQGIFDLALDAVGLLTLGAGKAAQAGNVLGKALSTARQAAKAARFVGAAVVEVFNPLAGVGDLLVGAGRLVGKGSHYVRRQLNQLRGADGSYDLLKVASKQYGEAATGVFKVGGESVEGGAVLQNGKWFALDTNTMRPGVSLDDFVVRVRAVDGKISQLPSVADGELSNRLFREFKVPESTISGISRNSQGVYAAADGHLSHIRHTDSTGQTAVYEVRQVTRTAEGTVQARVYHNNRQTSLVLEHVQGDQWRRLGARGGSPVPVKSDLGAKIGQGGEGVIYESLDGKSVYKDFGPTSLTSAEGFVDMEVFNLNKYYGDGFAKLIVDEGRRYIKMGKIEGVTLNTLEKGSLPVSARSLMDDVIADLESKDIFHGDLQLQNFIYSKNDNKIYPVDMNGLPGEFLVTGVIDRYQRGVAELRADFNQLIARAT